jgi:PAS domain S-box-containing protein
MRWPFVITDNHHGLMNARIVTPLDLRAAIGVDGDLPAIRILIQTIRTAVLIADRSGLYVAANRAACALTGYSEDELMRKGLHDLTGQADERVAEPLWRAFIEQGEQRGEFTLRRKDGSAVVVRYEALSNVAPGLHASFLEPA